VTYDASLRPNDWDSFIGQQVLKERLQISIDSAVMRNAPLDHVLLYGPPGVGKTTLAQLISGELMQKLTQRVCPVPLKLLYALIMEVGDVIFLDEIHRLPKKDQESLLPVLEDRMIQFDNGNFQPIANPFTIIGATTELSSIIKPLRDRFIHKPKFEDYTAEDMQQIVTQMCRRVGMDIDHHNAFRLGIASAGVPRQARNLVLAARDVESTEVEDVLKVTGITEEGYTEDHLQYVRALHKLGGTAGVEVLSNYINQPKDVILDLELLLVKRGVLTYTPKGRSMLLLGLAVLDKYGY
jgi:Holliday junction DNA helicase RuvB